MSETRSCDVLVTGVEERQGLAVLRALGKAGLRVCAAGLEADSLGFRSRFATRTLVYPSPYEDKAAMARAILEEVRAQRIPIVFPVTESTVIALDEHRDAFAGLARLAMPARDVLHSALDKRITLAIARRIGVPVPESIHPSSVDDAVAFADRVGYPIVIKPPAQRIFAGTRGSFEFKVAYVRSRAELHERMARFAGEGAFPLLQEYCGGIKMNHGCLRTNGRLSAVYQYRGARELPLTGGVTCLHESVALHPLLVEHTTRLLDAMQWDGLAMVEYRFDEQTGRAVLMEVNGRTWAPIAGALGLGLDFATAAYRYLAHDDAPALPTYRAGILNRYLRGDLESLWSLLSNATPRDMTLLPSRSRAVLDLIAGFDPRVQSEMMDVADPLPGLVELSRLTRTFAQRIGGTALRALRRRIARASSPSVAHR